MSDLKIFYRNLDGSLMVWLWIVASQNYKKEFPSAVEMFECDILAPFSGVRDRPVVQEDLGSVRQRRRRRQVPLQPPHQGRRLPDAPRLRGHPGSIKMVAGRLDHVEQRSKI